MALSNELLCVLTLLTTLGGILGAFYLGQAYLVGFIVVALVLANVVAVKVVSVFGTDMTPGTFMFSSIMLGTDVLAERYGKKAAHRSVMVGFAAMLLFVVLSQLVVLFQPVVYATEASGALAQVFGASPRVFAASVLTYIIWQNFDVWFYHRIHLKTGEKMLWLRNNLSTMVTATASTFTFFFLAFYGTPVDWVSLSCAGVMVYLIVALIDTPFMYLSKRIRPLDTREALPA